MCVYIYIYICMHVYGTRTLEALQRVSGPVCTELKTARYVRVYVCMCMYLCIYVYIHVQHAYAHAHV